MCEQHTSAAAAPSLAATTKTAFFFVTSGTAPLSAPLSSSIAHGSKYEVPFPAAAPRFLPCRGKNHGTTRAPGRPAPAHQPHKARSTERPTGFLTHAGSGPAVSKARRIRRLPVAGSAGSGSNSSPEPAHPTTYSFKLFLLTPRASAFSFILTSTKEKRSTKSDQ